MVHKRPALCPVTLTLCIIPVEWDFCVGTPGFILDLKTNIFENQRMAAAAGVNRLLFGLAPAI